MLIQQKKRDFQSSAAVYGQAPHNDRTFMMQDYVIYIRYDTRITLQHYVPLYNNNIYSEVL